MKKIFLISILSHTVTVLSAQVITQLSFVAPLTSIFDIKYINNHILVSQQGLKSFDIIDPFNPVLSATVTYPGSYAYQLTAEGKNAYMAEGGNGTFAVYDISNIDAPFLSGSVNIPATSFLLGGDIVPHGDYVYMTGSDSLYTVNVSDSSAPEVVNVQQIPSAGIEGGGMMRIIGNSLFVTTTSSLKIYDISVPETPVMITSLDYTHNSESGISADTLNQRIFLPWVSTLQTALGFDAYNVSDPLLPVYLFSDSTTFSSGDYGKTAYHSNILFITSGGGLRVFDVSDSSHHYLGSFTGQDVANSSVALDVSDSLIFNGRGSGFEILELTGGFPTSASALFSIHQENNIYPNPCNATDGFTIFLTENSKNSSVSIIDLNGRQVAFTFSDSKDENQVHVQTIWATPGIYFLSVQNKNRISTMKIFINQ
ncbi:MAG: T9SS type A sorting domain-containing protein [Chitinophagales bacterium]